MFQQRAEKESKDGNRSKPALDFGKRVPWNVEVVKLGHFTPGGVSLSLFTSLTGAGG